MAVVDVPADGAEVSSAGSNSRNGGRDVMGRQRDSDQVSGRQPYNHNENINNYYHYSILPSAPSAVGSSDILQFDSTIWFMNWDGDFYLGRNTTTRNDTEWKCSIRSTLATPIDRILICSWAHVCSIRWICSSRRSSTRCWAASARRRFPRWRPTWFSTAPSPHRSSLLAYRLPNSQLPQPNRKLRRLSCAAAGETPSSSESWPISKMMNLNPSRISSKNPPPNTH